MADNGVALDDMREIIDEFMIEADEIISKLDEDMVKLEKRSDDLDLLNEIFRGAHTIKGTSGFLGFDRVSELTHKMEDVLNKLRKGELRTNAAIMDVLLESIDTLKVLLDDVRQGRESTIDLSAVKAKLIAIDQGQVPEIPAPAASKSTGKKNGKGKKAKAAAGSAAAATVSEPVPPIPVEAVEEESPEPEPAADTASVPTAGRGALELKRGADQTIRVDVNRLDSLMNIMSELVLGRNALLQFASKASLRFEGDELFEELNQTATQINFITTELQMSVMKMRMLPIGKVFNKFPRVVRDLARQLNKEVELTIHGEETELDKSVIEEIGDPLVHLVRNAVDHGIELPDVRERSGKPRQGTIKLSASQEGSNIVIRISDDGAGLDVDRIREKAAEKKLGTAEEIQRMSDRDIFSFIFHPGFSTAKVISDVSGRGVGMDVVRTNIEKLKGLIDIESARGQGTAIVIKLPLTLAIVQGLLVETGSELFILPLASVSETVKITRDEIHSINQREVIRLRDAVLPIVDLATTFFKKQETRAFAGRQNAYVVVLGLADRRLGLVVERLLGQEEVVIKPLGELLGQTPGIAGATIMGDGRVRLIVDPVGIFSMVK